MSKLQAWCPDCRAELSQEYLGYPIMGCPRCERVIYWPDTREPPPPQFEQLEQAACRTSVRLARAWSRGGAKKRAQVMNRLKSLVQDLDSA